MTGEQHPQDHHCGNCKNIGCKEHGFYSQYPEECQHFSQKKGCASHSSAAGAGPDVKITYEDGAAITGHELRLLNWVIENLKDERCLAPLIEIQTGIRKREEMYENLCEQHDEQIRQQAAEAARREVLESPEHPEGVTLKLCECGNDTFRFVETADYLPEYGTWEGDEVLRICTKCGKNHGCLADMKTGKSISRKALKSLRSGEGVQR